MSKARRISPARGASTTAGKRPPPPARLDLLQAAADICAASPDAGAAGREALGSRFRWLTAPRSTVVQPGPVHTGLTDDPDAEADRLLRLLVLPVEG